MARRRVARGRGAGPAATPSAHHAHDAPRRSPSLAPSCPSSPASRPASHRAARHDRPVRGGPARRSVTCWPRPAAPPSCIELAIYPTYVFVAYRDPADPSASSRGMWRDGDGRRRRAQPDRRSGRRRPEPELFGLGRRSTSRRIPPLVADAPTHYDVPVDGHPRADRPLPAVRRAGARPGLRPAHRGRPQRRRLRQLHRRRHLRRRSAARPSDVALLHRRSRAPRRSSARPGPSSPPTGRPRRAARAGP